eukprot:5510717-Prymnesium_polylepis.1
MPPRKKDFIPPEARGTPRRSIKPIARCKGAPLARTRKNSPAAHPLAVGTEDEEDDDDDMPLGQSRIMAAESRLTQGAMIERCRAVLDLMQLRPDAVIFAKPVSADDVPDYLEIIDNPSARRQPPHARLAPTRCLAFRSSARVALPDRSACGRAHACAARGFFLAPRLAPTCPRTLTSARRQWRTR